MGIGASRSRSGEEGVALTLSTMSAKEMFHNLYLPAEGYRAASGPSTALRSLASSSGHCLRLRALCLGPGGTRNADFAHDLDRLLVQIMHRFL